MLGRVNNLYIVYDLNLYGSIEAFSNSCRSCIELVFQRMSLNKTLCNKTYKNPQKKWQTNPTIYP